NSETLNELSRLREQRSEYADKLLLNIKQRLPQLEELLAEAEDHWGIEDSFYRFYHQSFKVYHLQHTTEKVCKTLQDLLPSRSMNQWFSEIIAQGTGHEFEMSHNQDWLHH